MLTIDANTLHIVCYSGGHSSALVAVEVFRRYGRDKLVLLNHDINPRVEDEDIKRFKREVAAWLQVPITYANHAKVDQWDQFDVVVDAQAFKVGSQNVICTSRLKTEPFHKWLKENVPNKNCMLYYGFDANEMHRVQRRIGILAAQGYHSQYPLALWERTLTSIEELGIAPPLTYSQFKHANCQGCIKGGRQHWYVVYCTRPDIFAKGKDAEDKIGYSVIKSIYLDELEPMFARMQAAGVVPTEHVHHTKFWVDAKKRVEEFEAHTARQDVIEGDAVDDRPCECFV